MILEIKDQFITYLIASVSLLIALTLNDLIKHFFLKETQNTGKYILYSFFIIVMGLLFISVLTVSID